jgi:hypothetical protein
MLMGYWASLVVSKKNEIQCALSLSAQASSSAAVRATIAYFSKFLDRFAVDLLISFDYSRNFS